MQGNIVYDCWPIVAYVDEIRHPLSKRNSYWNMGVVHYL